MNRREAIESAVRILAPRIPRHEFEAVTDHALGSRGLQVRGELGGREQSEQLEAQRQGAAIGDGPVPDRIEHRRVAYDHGAAAGGVGWEYLAAIHLVETRMGRIKGDSTAGAQGPMQFIPSTWAAYGRGGDVTSNRDAIHAAARYLKASGAPADMARALRAYNNSARYVRAVTAYARQMEADERAYLGYHAWQVYYGARLLPEVRDLRRSGSCAIDLCRVAEGALDGYVKEGINLWDHAAGGLIARLAGARTLLVAGAAGNEALVCGPEHGFTDLISVVRSAGFLRE